MKLKNLMLGAILAVVAILGPMVAYAGVSVIYPSSDQNLDLIATPPLTFSQGADYTLASTLGFASGFATDDDDASFSITLKGLGGGQLTIDRYTNITKASSVSSYKMQVATALSGSLAETTEITTLKIRLWTGTTAPTADGSTGVCAVLDLLGDVDSESTNSCTATTNVQVVYALASGSAGTGSVSIRPSSIVFA